MYVTKVILEAPSFDEGTLTMGDHGVELWCKTISDDLGEELSDAVNERDGLVVGHALRIRVLQQQDADFFVDGTETAVIHVPKCIQGQHDIVSNDRPGSLQKSRREAV